MNVKPETNMFDGLTYEVEAGLLYGRPGPSKSLWNLPQMRARGLRVVVSLANTVDAHEIARVGLRHYRIPFEEKLHWPPRANSFLPEILHSFDAVLEKHLPGREAILVHCNSGKDRTGLVLAYYLITRRQMSAKRAIRFLRSLKPDALTANKFEQVVLSMDGGPSRM